MQLQWKVLSNIFSSILKSPPNCQQQSSHKDHDISFQNMIHSLEQFGAYKLRIFKSPPRRPLNQIQSPQFLIIIELLVTNEGTLPDINVQTPPLLGPSKPSIL